ncbi:MAG: presenilin family intramembrane aspartyl protease PSH [Thermoplasmata archaeon]
MRTITQYILMFLSFLNTVLLSMVLYFFFAPMGGQAYGSQTNNPLIAVYYFVIIIIFTIIMLFLMRHRKEHFLKGFYFIAIGLILFLIFSVLFSYVIPGILGYYLPSILGLVIGFLLPLYLYKRPNWITTNIVGIIVAGGSAAVLGTNIGILPVVVFLIILIFYDLYAVKFSKHMVTLAEGTVKSGLPALFVFPDSDTVDVKEIKMDGERTAMFMGYGDAAIPSILIVSVMYNYNMSATLFTFFGALIAILVLFIFLRQGKPLPGLPFLNTGALLGLFMYLLVNGIVL